MISKEYIELIEAYRHFETKEACVVLNNIRSHVGGGWSESCFCNSKDIKDFIKDFNIWYELLKQEQQ